jgi:UDP-N-acetylmuramoyl-L-alanyl-D-glutamate--2,6-diaminopimelate ligase
MPNLKDLLLAVPGARVVAGDAGVDVQGLCLDSRQAAPGMAFVAVRGTTVDGHQFIPVATEKGATVIVCEEAPAAPAQGVSYVVVSDSAKAAGLLADAFYGSPSSRMTVVGVTGTNGKTTCATLLYQLFTALGYKCGMLSTVENRIGEEVVPSTHTTPDPISLHALLARMQAAGCTHAFMEVSSHAVDQKRIAGIRFAGGVFTNITHDHLDYHKTFDAYIKAKKGFFDDLPAGSFALVNADDKRGLVMMQNTEAMRCTYSLKVPSTVKGKVLENNLTGLVMQVDATEAHFRMIGTFNAYNLLAVYGAATLLGEDKHRVLSALTGLHGAPGRFETLRSPKDGILGIVDYAHTPDALLNVLATIKQLKVDGQQLITVVGCGGNRDAAKRPVMAAAACEHSERAILTSDNPRNEDPEAILNEMETDLTAAQRRKVLRITDRKEAIKTACALAGPGDVILVAGKGHETYQEIAGVKHPFDDREVLAHAFNDLGR